MNELTVWSVSLNQLYKLVGEVEYPFELTIRHNDNSFGRKFYNCKEFFMFVSALELSTQIFVEE